MVDKFDYVNCADGKDNALCLYDEGNLCPEITDEGESGCACDGRFEYINQEPCSCHINPPCWACVDAPLTCNKCGYQPNEG